MDDPNTTYLALGEALLEELIVRAGLKQAHDVPLGPEVEVALNFTVRSDGDHALVIRTERIGHAPLELRVNLE